MLQLLPADVIYSLKLYLWGTDVSDNRTLQFKIAAIFNKCNLQITTVCQT